MPLCNIIDRRTNKYRWLKVEAIIEPTVHNNNVRDGSDQAEDYDRDAHIGYWERNGISLMAAVSWANEFPMAVTLFLYDPGTNTEDRAHD